MDKKYVFRKRVNILAATLIDAVGYCFLRLFHRPKHRSKKGPKNVLIIRLDHLGDVLSATAVPKILKENFTACRVTFLTSSWAAPLLENNPFVDEVILYDAPWFSKSRYQKTARLNFFNLVQILAKKKFDLGLGLRGDLRENILMSLAGVAERVGYGITGGGFFLTKEVVYRKKVHETIHVFDLMSALGIQCHSLEPRLYFTETETQKFNERLEKLGLGPKDKILCLLIGAGSSSKTWPMEHVNQFLKEFSVKHTEIKMLLVGTSQTLASKLKGVDGKQIMNLVGETSLRELSLLTRRSIGFVGPDSGPTHMAAASGIPTIFLYSGTNDFEQWKPLSECAVILNAPVSCSPCGLEVCPVEGHPCMSGISSDKLLKILETRLN